MHNIKKEGGFERLHFDRNTVHVKRGSVDVRGLLGFPIDDRTIAALSGAPTGSVVDLFEMTVPMAAKEEDDVPPGLYFRISNSAYIQTENRVGIYQRDGGAGDDLGVYLDLVDFRSPGESGSKAVKGLAARMVGNMVRAAWKLTYFTHLRLLAAGGRISEDRPGLPGQRWGGYNAWPQYGFDMPLIQETIDIIDEFTYYPPGLAHCALVSDVLICPGGRDFWRVVGDGAYMEFDLAPNSASVSKLNEVLGDGRYN